MVELKVRLGAKGQVVIPKILREQYRIYPKQEVIMREEKEGIIIQRPQINIAQKLKEIAMQVSRERKNKKIVIDPHSIYKQYDKRAKRAGIKL